MHHPLSRRSVLLGLSAAPLTLLAADPVSASAKLEERADLADVFTEQGVRGTFALFEPDTERLVLVDRARAERRYPPASTFKIANSLIALETGVVKDEREVIPYGGKPQPFKQWEQDMNLRDAIRASNVPVYQEVARRIGPERMRTWLRRLGYGNMRIGEVVDRFWLDGPLETTAVEQARFVARLARRELPVSERSQRLVRDFLRHESQGDASLFAKTGWLTSQTPHVGWWTGWVERGDKVYAFSLNIDMTADDQAPKRLLIGRALLNRLGALPAAPG